MQVVGLVTARPEPYTSPKNQQVYYKFEMEGLEIEVPAKLVGNMPKVGETVGAEINRRVFQGRVTWSLVAPVQVLAVSTPVGAVAVPAAAVPVLAGVNGKK